MSPTNLGALPSNQPAPVGSIQRKLSDNVGAEMAWPAAWAAFLAPDAMQIAVSPTRRTWWICEGRLVARGITTWARSDWGIYLNVADLNGRGGVRTAHGLATDNQWQTLSLRGAFLIDPGSYTCTMFSVGGNAYYYRAVRFMALYGYTIGEGVA